jgi:hypothetical protein
MSFSKKRYAFLKKFLKRNWKKVRFLFYQSWWFLFHRLETAQSCNPCLEIKDFNHFDDMSVKLKLLCFASFLQLFQYKKALENFTQNILCMIFELNEYHLLFMKNKFNSFLVLNSFISVHLNFIPYYFY